MEACSTEMSRALHPCCCVRANFCAVLPNSSHGNWGIPFASRCSAQYWYVRYLNFLNLVCRTTGRCKGGSGFYTENVCGFESRSREDHLLAFHMRYGYGKHSVCVCCSQRHDPSAQFEGVQLGVVAPVGCRHVTVWKRVVKIAG